MLFIRSIPLALPLVCLNLLGAEPTATNPPVPSFRIKETVQSYQGTTAQDYLAFPSLVKSGRNEIRLPIEHRISINATGDLSL